jgi:hypothetical protein
MSAPFVFTLPIAPALRKRTWHRAIVNSFVRRVPCETEHRFERHDARGLYRSDLFGDIAQPGTDPPALAGQSASYHIANRWSNSSFYLQGGLKQLGMVPEVSYVLGFSPQNEKMDGHFHTLKVTLTGKQKYAVQARRGYYAPKKVDDPQKAEKQEMQDALFSRDEIYDLAFTLQTQYFKTGDGGAQLSLVSHIGLKDLRFRVADENTTAS